MNSGFIKHKPKNFNSNIDNNRWFFTQAGVKLLTINEKTDGVIVSLLHFTNSKKTFSTVSSWKLPFKLNNIKAFLMYPYLSDEEKEESKLIETLKSLATQQLKFEELMLYRINSVIKSISSGESGKYEPRIRDIGTEHDYADRLANIYSPSYKDNIFIKSVLEKNNV